MIDIMAPVLDMGIATCPISSVDMMMVTNTARATMGTTIARTIIDGQGLARGHRAIAGGTTIAGNGTGTRIVGNADRATRPMAGPTITIRAVTARIANLGTAMARRDRSTMSRALRGTHPVILRPSRAQRAHLRRPACRTPCPNGQISQLNLLRVVGNLSRRKVGLHRRHLLPDRKSQHPSSCPHRQRERPLLAHTRQKRPRPPKPQNSMPKWRLMKFRACFRPRRACKPPNSPSSALRRWMTTSSKKSWAREHSVLCTRLAGKSGLLSLSCLKRRRSESPALAGAELLPGERRSARAKSRKATSLRSKRSSCTTIWTECPSPLCGRYGFSKVSITPMSSLSSIWRSSLVSAPVLR